MTKEEFKIFEKEYAKKVTNELSTETLIDAAIKFITDNTRPSVIGHRFCEFYEHTACLTCVTLDPDGHTYSIEFSFIEVLNLIKNRFEESKHDLEILDLMIKKSVDKEEYDDVKKLIFKYERRINRK